MVALQAACVTEEGALAESLLELTALRNDNAAYQKRIQKLTSCLAERLSAGERSVADKRYTENSVAATKMIPR